MLRGGDRTWTTLRSLARRTPVLRGARLAALFAVKRLAERWAVISFGQRGEDLVLDGLLAGLPEAARTYVEVGANHPVRNSNTYRLYLRGWRGVLVDANPELVEMCRRARPHDRAIEAAVSDSAAERVFEIPEETRLGGFAEYDRRTPARRRIVIAPRTLTSILEQVGVDSRFGVLSVDCEGSDLEVMRSLDFERYRPSLIVVEQEALDLTRLEADPLTEHLARSGYGLVAYDGMNGYYAESREPA